LAAHDAGLRALGLLDFVRLDLSSSGAPRADLIDELIANYQRYQKKSFVRGKEIKISYWDFAEALHLPGGRTYRIPAGVDPAAVTSAAKEFIKVYFQRRLKEADAALSKVKHGRAHCVTWDWLIVGLLEEELEQHFNPSKSTMTCYYGAHLQRLIWVQRPELFQLPPEPYVPMIHRRVPQEEQGSNRSAVRENQSSESGMHMPTLFQLPPEPSVADAPVVPRPQKESEMHKIDLAPKKIDLAPENFTATSKKIDLASDKLDAASKKFDSVFNVVNAASKMMEAASKQLEERAKQLGEQDGDLRAIESLNQALVTKERESNDELQAARKILIEVCQQTINTF
jgi:hypothetical protein